MDLNKKDAARWRETARSCRELAERLSSYDARAQMFRLAETYERMADHAEVHGAPNGHAT